MSSTTSTFRVLLSEERKLNLWEKLNPPWELLEGGLVILQYVWALNWRSANKEFSKILQNLVLFDEAKILIFQKLVLFYIFW